MDRVATMKDPMSNSDENKTVVDAVRLAKIAESCLEKGVESVEEAVERIPAMKDYKLFPTMFAIMKTRARLKHKK